MPFRAQGWWCPLILLLVHVGIALHPVESGLLLRNEPATRERTENFIRFNCSNATVCMAVITLPKFAFQFNNSDIPYVTISSNGALYFHGNNFDPQIFPISKHVIQNGVRISIIHSNFLAVTLGQVNTKLPLYMCDIYLDFLLYLSPVSYLCRVPCTTLV